jgi:hypothetical protein
MKAKSKKTKKLAGKKVSTKKPAAKKAKKKPGPLVPISAYERIGFRKAEAESAPDKQAKKAKGPRR